MDVVVVLEEFVCWYSWTFCATRTDTVCMYRCISVDVGGDDDDDDVSTEAAYVFVDV